MYTSLEENDIKWVTEEPLKAKADMAEEQSKKLKTADAKSIIIQINTLSM